MSSALIIEVQRVKAQALSLKQALECITNDPSRPHSLESFAPLRAHQKNVEDTNYIWEVNGDDDGIGIEGGVGGGGGGIGGGLGGGGGSSSSTMSSSTNISDKKRLENAVKNYRQLEQDKDAEIAALQRLLTTNARTDQIEQQLASMTAERNRLQQEKVYQEGELQQQGNDIGELRANNLHLSTLEKQYETQKDENATLRDQLKKMKQEEAVRKAGRKGARAAAAAAPLLPYSNLTKGLKDANRKLNQLLSGPLETIMKKLDELHVTINDEENKNEEENTEENNNEEENNEEENTEEEQTGETVQNAVPP
jgi:DNA repair exonuclease SbcCD ATPase subunit